MNQLQAIPTTHGLSVLTSSLKSSVKKFKLLGNIGSQAANVYEFHSETIHASYYDANGVLTFEMRLPIETHFNEYMYKVHIIDDAGAVVIECETPKVALPKGIGGMLTLKSTVTGNPGDLVFQNSDFLTETEFMARFASKMQAMPYDPLRDYSAGETCYTKDVHTGELSYWQWYSNVESLAGKSPLLVANRHVGWSDNTKPFYWMPYTGDQVGMPFLWLDASAPEWAVMEINVDLPVAVYWRLARRYPHLVTGNTINTGEIRGEFLRVLDQGRGVDDGRVIGSAQDATHIRTAASDYFNKDGSIGATIGTAFSNADYFGWPKDRGAVRAPNGAKGFMNSGQTDNGFNLNMSTSAVSSQFIAMRSRNVARPMAIAI